MKVPQALGPLSLLMVALLLPLGCGSDESPGEESTTSPHAGEDEEAEDSWDDDSDDSEDGDEEWDTEETWTFEGQVFDLLRDEPISDAKVVFDNDFVKGVKSVSTTTGVDGYYEIEVAALGETGYLARITHPDFDSRNTYTDAVLDKSRDERLMLGTGVQFHSADGMFFGEDGFSTSLDLYLFPLVLTEEESRERGDAMRGLRGGGGP